MADINLNFGTEDLENLKKQLQDILKSYKEIYAYAQKTGVITEDEATKQKILANEALRLSNEKKKLERIQAKLEQQDTRAQENINIQKGLIGGLEKQVRDLTKSWKSATDAGSKDSVKKNLDQIKQKLQEAKGETNKWGVALGSFQFKFNALGNIAANVLSSMTRGAKQFILDSVRMAAATEGVRNAFERLNKPDLLNELRKATRGAVNDLSLMKSAVLAENFRIPLDQLATFLKYAGNQALRTGQDFDYLVDSIIRGLGRESVLVLDNLGLSAKEIQEEAKKTGSFFEGAANVIQRDMAKAGEVTDTAASSLARYNAAIDNLKISFGKLITESDTYARLLEGMALSFNKFSDESLSFWQKAMWGGERYKEYLKGINAEMQTFNDLIDDMGGADTPIDNLDSKSQILSVTIKSLREEVKNLTEQKELLDVTDKKGIASINKQIFAIEEQIQKLNDLGKAGKSIVQINPFATDEGLLEQAIEDSKTMWDEYLTYINDKDAETDRELRKRLRKRARLAANIMDEDIANFIAQKEAMILIFSGLLGQMGALAAENTVFFKVMAVAEATINAYVAAASALRETKGGPFAKIAAAAIVLSAAMAVVAKVKSVTVPKYAEGGEIGGKSHSQGGTTIEAEKGEFIIRRSAYARNKELIKAINSEDSQRIMQALRVDKKINIQTNKDYTKELYEMMKKQPIYGEDNEFFILHTGNKVFKIRK